MIECHYCHNRITKLQTYIVSDPKTGKRYKLCPSCADKVMKQEIKSLEIPKIITQSAGMSISELKSDYDNQRKFLIGIK